MKRRSQTRSAKRVPAAEAASVRPSMRLLGVWLALVPYAIWPPGVIWDSMNVWKWPFASAGILACLLLIAREAKRTRDKSPADQPSPFSFFSLGAGLILGGLALSSLFSPVIGLGLLTGLREATLVLLAVCVAAHRPRQSEAAWVMGCLLTSMGAQAGIALMQCFFPRVLGTVLPIGIDPEGGRGAILGTIGNPEYLASWLAVGMTSGFVLTLGGKDPRRERAGFRGWAPGLVGLLALAAIFLSGGRGAILAAAGALLIYGLVRMPTRGKPQTTERDGRPPNRFSPLGPVIAAIAVVGTGLFAVWLALDPSDRGDTLPHRLAQIANVHSASMRHRLGLLAVTSQMIARDPILGAGPGRYGAAYGEMQAKLAEQEQGVGYWSLAEVLTNNYVSEAHCDPLQWWAEYGLLPLLGLFMMLTHALRRPWKGLRPGGGPTVYQPALWVGLLTLGLNMWVSFPLHVPVRAMTFWVLLGLLAGSANVRPQSDHAEGIAGHGTGDKR